MNDWLLVYDEESGWGHARRMRALSASLAAAGAAPSLRPIRGSVRSPRIVVDTYAARADDPARFDAELIVAFDDLGRDLSVDLVVEPSPGADGGRHPSASRVLTGASYAVVDPGIRGLERRPIGATATTVLVSFGAADTAGMAARVAGELAGLLPSARVELPVGSWWGGAVPPGVQAVDCPDGLAPRLALADLAVVGGGVTLLESLALGRPTLAVMMAENQRLALEYSSSVGALVHSRIEAVAAEAAAVADDADRRAALAVNAASLVDGMGADRVAAEVLGLGG